MSKKDNIVLCINCEETFETITEQIDGYNMFCSICLMGDK